MIHKNCCTPPVREKTLFSANKSIENCVGDHFEFSTVTIPGNNSFLGTDKQVIPIDEEGPYRSSKVRAFEIMKTCVTNEMFNTFVRDTNYITEADKYGWSFCFFSHIKNPENKGKSVPKNTWWHAVDKANWRLVNGPGSEGDYVGNHPVVHVSWNDAQTFAKWAGGRLPTEAEWEHAARGGLGDVRYPWGDQEPDDLNYQPCNIWQGNFPKNNTCKDGFAATAPVDSFEANNYGIYNMCGNVWEWTSDPYKIRSLSKASRRHAQNMRGMKIMKGGSFLCHKSYCHRYRIAARTGNTPDSTTAHQGFRLVFDLGNN